MGGLEAGYDVDHRLIGKLVGDFLLVIIELFSLGAFVLSQFARLTDRRTDGQILIGKTALHTKQRGKKGDFFSETHCRQSIAADILVAVFLSGPTGGLSAGR